MDDSSNSVFTRLCSHCVEKLEISYNFQQQCDSSYEILQQYDNHSVRSSFVILKHMYIILKLQRLKIEVAASDDDTQEELTIEFCKTEQDDNDYNTDESSNDQESEHRSSVRKKRLRQFSHREVTQAIENVKKPFVENIECIKCGFVGTNARALSVHMSHIHKLVNNEIEYFFTKRSLVIYSSILKYILHCGSDCNTIGAKLNKNKK